MAMIDPPQNFTELATQVERWAERVGRNMGELEGRRREMEGRRREMEGRSFVCDFYLHYTCLAQGAVVVLMIAWNCDLDRSGCDPVYGARRCALVHHVNVTISLRVVMS